MAKTLRFKRPDGLIEEQTMGDPVWDAEKQDMVTPCTISIEGSILLAPPCTVEIGSIKRITIKQVIVPRRYTHRYSPPDMNRKYTFSRTQKRWKKRQLHRIDAWHRIVFANWQIFSKDVTMTGYWMRGYSKRAELIPYPYDHHGFDRFWETPDGREILTKLGRKYAADADQRVLEMLINKEL